MWGQQFYILYNKANYIRHLGMCSGAVFLPCKAHLDAFFLRYYLLGRDRLWKSGFIAEVFFLYMGAESFWSPPAEHYSQLVLFLEENFLKIHPPLLSIAPNPLSSPLHSRPEEYLLLCSCRNQQWFFCTRTCPDLIRVPRKHQLFPTC